MSVNISNGQVPPPIKTTAWLIVEGTTRYSSLYGKEVMSGLKVVGARAKKPAVEANQEAIEITIELPGDYFADQSPQVHVKVPSRAPSQAATTVTAQVKPKAPSAAAAIIHGN